MQVSPLLRMQLHVIWGIREKFLMMNFGVKHHVALGLRRKLQINICFKQNFKNLLVSE